MAMDSMEPTGDNAESIDQQSSQGTVDPDQQENPEGDPLQNDDQDSEERVYTFDTASNVYERQKYASRKRRHEEPVDTLNNVEPEMQDEDGDGNEDDSDLSHSSSGAHKRRSAVYRHSTGSPNLYLHNLYGKMRGGQKYCSNPVKREYGTVIDQNRQPINIDDQDVETNFVRPIKKSASVSENGSSATKGKQWKPQKSAGPAFNRSGSNDVEDEHQRLIDIVEREILDTSTISVKWGDIAGLGKVKKIIQEIVIWPMLRPDLFTGLKAPPQGLLLFGPPGTGKTTLGRCIASQANATFYCISASSLTSKWVGENEKLVRALFESARAHQPAVVFIDEIDALLSNRTEAEHDSTRRLKTQFFTELDGIKNHANERILVVGATNRPGDLDSAALRRLTKRLYVPLPDLNGRAEMLNSLLRQESHSLTEESMMLIATKTEGFSCDDLKKLCQEAALGPIRCLTDIQSVSFDQVPPIRQEDFANALMVVRSSVGNEQLAQYEEFDRRLGSTGAG